MESYPVYVKYNLTVPVACRLREPQTRVPGVYQCEKTYHPYTWNTAPILIWIPNPLDLVSSIYVVPMHEHENADPAHDC